jgi:hypothetical protein
VYTGKIRTIIRDPRFEQEMARIVSNVQRADEFLEGVEQILSRKPESGYQLEDSNVWFIAGHTVDIALYYTFDADYVHFLSVEKITPPQL